MSGPAPDPAIPATNATAIGQRTPLDPQARRLLPILLTLYGLAYLDRQVLALLVDPIRHDLQVTDFQISLLQGGAFVVFFTLCALPIGWAVDRYSRRKIIFGGVLIWSIATTASGTARNFVDLMIARCFVGAGEAALAPAAYSLLGDTVPKNQLARAMAIFSVGAILGITISLVGGGLIVHLTSGSGRIIVPIVGGIASWQLAFLVIGLPGIAMAFLIFLVPEPVRPPPKPGAANAVTILQFIAHVRRYRGFYTAHILGFSLMNVMTGGYVAWAPTMLIRQWGLPVSTVGAIIGTISCITGVSGMLISGHIADLLFRRGMHDAHLRYYVFAVPALTAGGALAAFGPHLYVVLAGMALVTFIAPFIAVAAAGLQIPTPPLLRGKASALFMFIYNIVGYGFGPTIMASLSERLAPGQGAIGLGIGVTFLIFGPLVSLTFALGLRPMRRAVAAIRH